MEFINTWWSLLPAIIAIVLALITKEVYSSLFIGIVTGGLLYSGFDITAAYQHIFVDGIISQLSDKWDVGILIFLVTLGCIVMLMSRAGGSAAFGKWASDHVKSKAGAQVSTMLLGILIFIDDYFNCLTVGSVMKPLTDKHHISREKLAYIIDSTAAPICIIAPISSWAAAVTGFVDGANGLSLFVSSIPYNFYALLTIVMVFYIAITNFDYGAMKEAERQHLAKILEKRRNIASLTGAEQQPRPPVSHKGKVIHLVLPITLLILCSIIGMIYTGGFFSGASFVDAFAKSDASVGLVYGSVSALIITIIFFVATKVLSFKDSMAALPEGFKSMVPAILVLTFAWTLKAMTDSLGAGTYVGGLMANVADNGIMMSLLPAMVFVVGIFLAFSTGTSWGTFGILIPIVVSLFGADLNNELMIISISACMAGAVCGDHCSPISDTTIMASAGAQCSHIRHVSTQIPYVITVASVTFVTYIIAGFTKAWYISLPAGLLLLLATLYILKQKSSK